MAKAGELIAYVGYDCTGPSLHVGHLLSIMMLRWLQKTGGKPIALDPTQEDAVRTLLRLMTEPPPQMPAEARSEMLRERRRTVRMGTRMSSMALLMWFACLPIA